MLATRLHGSRNTSLTTRSIRYIRPNHKDGVMKPARRPAPAVSHPTKRTARPGASTLPLDQPVPAMSTRDQRLQVDAATRTGGTTAARYRDGLTPIDPDIDPEDVSDDEQALDAAAALDADERQARPRQFETDT